MKARIYPVYAGLFGRSATNQITDHRLAVNGLFPTPVIRVVLVGHIHRETLPERISTIFSNYITSNNIRSFSCNFANPG